MSQNQNPKDRHRDSSEDVPGKDRNGGRRGRPGKRAPKGDASPGRRTARDGGRPSETRAETRAETRTETERGSRRATRRDEARQRMYHDLVFEAAEAVFAARGFEASTMQDVATEAGVSLHTVYSVFEGKNELYEEIRRTRAEEFVAALGEPLARVDDPLEALEDSVRAYVDYLADHPDFLRLHLREAKAWALSATTDRADSSDPSDPSDHADSAEGVERLARVVQRGIDTGVFHDGDAHMMALVGVAIVQVWLGRLLELEDSDRDEIVEEILQQLRRVYCVDPDDRRAAA